MKKLLLLSLLLLAGKFCLAQDITFVADVTKKADTLGKEIIFPIKLTNNSTGSEKVFIVRSQNDLPANWTSSLCLGGNCFASFLDSVETSVDFGSTPMQAGEVRDVSLHVVTTKNNGTAQVTLQAGTERNPNQRVTISFTAVTGVTAVNTNIEQPLQFQLKQNYPNPFNPTTNISYSIPYESVVKLNIYNSLGQLIKQLDNKVHSAGLYTTNVDLSRFASGIYFYTISAKSIDGKKEFISSKKMSLLK